MMPIWVKVIVSKCQGLGVDADQACAVKDLLEASEVDDLSCIFSIEWNKLDRIVIRLGLGGRVVSLFMLNGLLTQVSYLDAVLPGGFRVSRVLGSRVRVVRDAIWWLRNGPIHDQSDWFNPEAVPASAFVDDCFEKLMHQGA
jgi:hypothetical protein